MKLYSKAEPDGGPNEVNVHAYPDGVSNLTSSLLYRLFVFVLKTKMTVVGVGKKFGSTFKEKNQKSLHLNRVTTI